MQPTNLIINTNQEEHLEFEVINLHFDLHKLKN